VGQGMGYETTRSRHLCDTRKRNIIGFKTTTQTVLIFFTAVAVNIYKLTILLARTDTKLHYAAFITVISANLMKILRYLVI